jgi:predicted RNase H-like HicB family nuclease
MADKRFTLVCRVANTDLPGVLGHADTPAEALRMANDFTAKGRSDVRIGDNQARKHFDPVSFAREYGVR